MIDLENYARERLSSGRFAHVCGVVKAAGSLAQKHGADEKRVQTAAWLHDIYRELPEQRLRELAQEVGAVIPDGDPVTWHGPVCAARMSFEFAIDDEEIAEAVRWHTVGHPDMGLLSQILFVADAIEPTRRYHGIEELRLVAQENLPMAVAKVADSSISYLIAREKPIALSTVQLRNAIWAGLK